MNGVKPSVDTRPFLHDLDKVMNDIVRGAFITVKDREGRVNTMVLGWATAGYIWRRAIFMAPVRVSRHTYSLLMNADDFTVTIPHGTAMNEALKICGTKSGRDINKITEAGLVLEDGKHVVSPVVHCSGTVFECKIVYHTMMDEPVGDVGELFYPKGDLHRMFHGEIVERYEID